MFDAPALDSSALIRFSRAAMAALSRLLSAATASSSVPPAFQGRRSIRGLRHLGFGGKKGITGAEGQRGDDQPGYRAAEKATRACPSGFGCRRFIPGFSRGGVWRRLAPVRFPRRNLSFDDLRFAPRVTIDRAPLAHRERPLFPRRPSLALSVFARPIYGTARAKGTRRAPGATFGKALLHRAFRQSRCVAPVICNGSATSREMQTCLSLGNNPPRPSSSPAPQPGRPTGANSAAPPRKM